jgi:hypothetical protein
MSSINLCHTPSNVIPVPDAGSSMLFFDSEGRLSIKQPTGAVRVLEGVPASQAVGASGGGAVPGPVAGGGVGVGGAVGPIVGGVPAPAPAPAPVPDEPDLQAGLHLSVDGYFAQTALLILAMNPNAGPTAYLDQSPKRNQVSTLGGTPMTDRFERVAGWGTIEFTTGQRVLVNPSSAYDFGVGDFCVECWYRLGGAGPASRPLLVADGLRLAVEPTGQITFAAGAINIMTDPVPYEVWTHVAAVRRRGVTRVYVQGVAQGVAHDAATGGAVPVAAAGVVSIGNALDGGAALWGYIDSVRLTKGAARYRANFFPALQGRFATAGV